MMSERLSRTAAEITDYRLWQWAEWASSDHGSWRDSLGYGRNILGALVSAGLTGRVSAHAVLPVLIPSTGDRSGAWDDSVVEVQRIIDRLPPMLYRVAYEHYITSPWRLGKQRARRLGISPGRYSQLHAELLESVYVEIIRKQYVNKSMSLTT